MDDLWDVTYDVWIYANAARNAMRDGNIEDAEQQLDNIRRRLASILPDSSGGHVKGELKPITNDICSDGGQSRF